MTDIIKTIKQEVRKAVRQLVRRRPYSRTRIRNVGNVPNHNQLEPMAQVEGKGEEGQTVEPGAQQLEVEVPQMELLPQVPVVVAGTSTASPRGPRGSSSVTPRLPNFADLETRTGGTDVPRLGSAIQRLQRLLEGTEDAIVPSLWYEEIKSGVRGVHVISLSQRFGQDPPITWRELKRFVSLGFEIGVDSRTQAREAEDLRPNDGELVDDYCTRWIMGVTSTATDLVADGPYLAKALISKVSLHYGLPLTAEVLIADDQGLLSSADPLTVFSRVQKRLSALAGLPLLCY